MARHQAAEREKSVSVLASLLPFLSVLYSEFIFAYFAHMPITPVKVWMALGLGGIEAYYPTHSWRFRARRR